MHSPFVNTERAVLRKLGYGQDLPEDIQGMAPVNHADVDETVRSPDRTYGLVSWIWAGVLSQTEVWRSRGGTSLLALPGMSFSPLNSLFSVGLPRKSDRSSYGLKAFHFSRTTILRRRDSTVEAIG